ncbi:TMV resistance protein N-like [Gossypium australe]|uniref:TMV resistance protein N-like n=1 Tax=Gossypium australe TaxID=47621 RepID=A0A5B6WZY4_9ROSI|nr:TMV resistance protein N-like [Gossypium australe]
MKTYLQAQDLWNAVENDADPPLLRANPTIAQIRQHSEGRAKKHKAMACLQNGVSDVIFTRIMTSDSPKQAWERLNEKFMGSEKTRQQQLINLRRDFENLKMKEAETVKQYSDKIMATINSIRLFGEEFSESRVVEKVITTLPERFESKISSLEDSRDLTTISLSELVNSLYALEQRRANSKVKCSWLVDSGCSHHMATDEILFKELDRSFTSRIRIGNGSLIEAKGRGNVVINTDSGNKLISNVLYVPDIDQNLLSVVPMADKCFMLDVSQLEKKAYTNLVDIAGLWHMRLGHANFRIDCLFQSIRHGELEKGLS